MRKKTKLSKTSINKIEEFLKSNENLIIDKDELITFLTNEVKVIKDCSEALIINNYLENVSLYYYDEDIDYSKLKIAVRNKLASLFVSNDCEDNIDIYFNEIKRQYINHPVDEQNDLEFTAENKDIFIQNNLKQVITCAKKFLGLGLPFEDLIQAGNMGLMVAFDKYDKNKANLRISIIKNIDLSELTSFTYKQAEDIIKKSFSYSKNLEQTLKDLPKEGFGSKELFIKWANDTIKTAAFSSVAFKWIMAYIRIELNKYGKPLRLPTYNSEDTEKYSIIRLDAENNYTEDVYSDDIMYEVVNDEFIVEDESMDNEEKNNTFKDIISSLLNTLDGQSRRIIKKRYGIGCAFEKSVSEIAYEEGLSLNKVKYIINSVFKTFMNNISPTDKETIKELLK